MRIRTLVPALACLAAAPLAIAADSTPAVKFDGFVDTIYSITNNEYADGVGAETGFDYAAKLGISATISDKVSAQVDLNIDSEGTVYSRQAYGTWKVTNEVELKTGKFISDYGWTAAYAPGLYRVNGGPITTFYGVDQVGVNAKTTMGDLTAALTVANGFFGEGDGSGEQTRSNDQDNEAYAVGLDVVYSMGDKGSVNLELIRDEDVGTGGLDGDGFHAGLNVTATPSKELTVGAELIVQTINNKGAGALGQDTDHTGVMGLVNYKLASAMPMSVTGQISFVDIEQNANADIATVGSSVTQMEYAVALLTNPAGTDKLGANLELNYTTTEEDGGDSTYSIGFAGELLYVF